MAGATNSPNSLLKGRAQSLSVDTNGTPQMQQLGVDAPPGWDENRRRSTLKRPPMKVITYRLDFVKNARPKVQSLENIKHKPGGGNVKVETQELSWTVDGKVNGEGNNLGSSLDLTRASSALRSGSRGENLAGNIGPKEKETEDDTDADRNKNQSRKNDQRGPVSFMIDENDGNAVRVTVVNGSKSRPAKQGQPVVNMYQPNNQPVNRPVKQPIAQPVSQPVNQPIEQPAETPAPFSSNEARNQDLKPRRFSKNIESRSNRDGAEAGDVGGGHMQYVNGSGDSNDTDIRRQRSASAEGNKKNKAPAVTRVPNSNNSEVKSNFNRQQLADRNTDGRNRTHPADVDAREVQNRTNTVEPRNRELNGGHALANDFSKQSAPPRNGGGHDDDNSFNKAAARRRPTGNNIHRFGSHGSTSDDASNSNATVNSTAKQQSPRDYDSGAQSLTRNNNVYKSSGSAVKQEALSSRRQAQVRSDNNSIPVSRRASGDRFAARSFDQMQRNDGPPTANRSQAASSQFGGGNFLPMVQQRSLDEPDQSYSKYSYGIKRTVRNPVSASVDDLMAPRQVGFVEKIDFTKGKQSVVLKFEKRHKTKLPRVAYLMYPGDQSQPNWNVLPRADRFQMRQDKMEITYATMHDPNVLDKQQYEQMIQRKLLPASNIPTNRHSNGRDSVSLSLQATTRATSRNDKPAYHATMPSRGFNTLQHLPPIEQQLPNASYALPITGMATVMSEPINSVYESRERVAGSSHHHHHHHVAAARDPFTFENAQDVEATETNGLMDVTNDKTSQQRYSVGGRHELEASEHEAFVTQHQQYSQAMYEPEFDPGRYRDVEMNVRQTNFAGSESQKAPLVFHQPVGKGAGDTAAKVDKTVNTSAVKQASVAVEASELVNRPKNAVETQTSNSNTRHNSTKKYNDSTSVPYTFEAPVAVDPSSLQGNRPRQMPQENVVRGENSNRVIVLKAPERTDQAPPLPPTYVVANGAVNYSQEESPTQPSVMPKQSKGIRKQIPANNAELENYANSQDYQTASLPLKPRSENIVPQRFEAGVAINGNEKMRYDGSQRMPNNNFNYATQPGNTYNPVVYAAVNMQPQDARNQQYSNAKQPLQSDSANWSASASNFGGEADHGSLNGSVHTFSTTTNSRRGSKGFADMQAGKKAMQQQQQPQPQTQSRRSSVVYLYD